MSSFPVVIDVTGTPAGLYGGSSANVSIIVKELQDVVVVPTDGHQLHHGGTTAVTSTTNGKKVIQPVTIGIAVGWRAPRS